MNRSPTKASLTLLLVVAGLVWFGSHPLRSATLAPISPPDTIGAREVLGGECEIRLAGSAEFEDRTVAGRPVFQASEAAGVRALPTELASARLRPGLVRVHGRVRRGTLPVAGYDLVFEGARSDWDYTDDEGRYEVELPAGAYAVLNGEGGPWTTNLIVSADRDELVQDVDLPLGVLRGLVVRADTGEEVEGATLTAVRTAATLGDPVQTDLDSVRLMARGGETCSLADGYFELVDLRGGSYVLTATHRECPPVSIDVDLADGGLREVRLQMCRGGELDRGE